MEAKITGTILVVKVVVDILKSKFPSLTGRTTQIIVLGLSIIGALYAAGCGDIAQMLTAIGAIFAGAIAADQVTKRSP